MTLSVTAASHLQITKMKLKSPLWSFLCTPFSCNSWTFASALVVKDLCLPIAEVQMLHYMSGMGVPPVQILGTFYNFRLVKDDCLLIFILPRIEKLCLQTVTDNGRQIQASARSRILQNLVFAFSQLKAFHQIVL